jgi:molecular chaperone IbpA
MKSLAKTNWESPFDSIFNLYPKEDTSYSNYPPHNLYKKSDFEWVLEVALAGFKKDDLEIFVEPSKPRVYSRTLVIKGNKPKPTEVPKEYRIRGIATRNFKLTFNLTEEAELISAKFEDGLLVIEISAEPKSSENTPIPIPIL